ncbi:D-Tyr-tRNA deacylase [Schizosaccharomyces cryophilus OY26]|uniref:D-aminoacyl-tRNA deacylase n=1 Tax=Schizosaccharomyces cryophilus (strain OY26 / ATCC MYA-4695 / CBS 11777 / NBRC 106824 / NRRL Y48691) TaxID=653667 RepID=S9W346_SCHCR|nr:D-Tyr-tRNA deacylase [Schizosaccharomyces cryophilus OY26]EPY52984.1 D-Tyr-tRNA deacylase [Schizosaccharomyces cryophilus OY26]
MKAVIQKVLNASVTVDNSVVSSVQKGLCILVGVGSDDTMEDVDKLCNKVLKLRLFENAQDQPWKQTILEVQGEILCVSQFTLHARVNKGAKPDFHRSMKGPEAVQLYESVLEGLKTSLGNDKVKNGVFGAMMNVQLTNNGPVTILYDTKE